ncbi:MAG TPA: hypothetical protein VFD32_17580 [Dehalococcoidia bacterium]|nr:hypothetical protein [Dehalococcoidia bacterium]
MTTKAELHHMIDELPDNVTDEAARLLRTLGGPLMQALFDAPEDDEPTTPEEDAGTAEAREQYRRGEGRPWKDVRRELLGE